jgi:hypothetical protein
MEPKTEEQQTHHWVLAYFESAEKGIFYCSLGRHPSFYGLTEFMERNCSHYRYNKTRYQSSSSTLCGAFVSVCLYFLACEFDFTSILQLLHPRDYSHNDAFVMSVFNHIVEKAAPRYKESLKAEFHKGEGVPECTGKCQYCVYIDEEYPKQITKGF